MTSSQKLGRFGSVVIGIICALAGVVALGYTLDGIEYLKFFKRNMLGGLVGALVPGVLCFAAFYMAFKFIKRPSPKENS